MKQITRILIIAVLVVSIGFSVTFPKGIIQFEDGNQMRVKKVEMRENMVFYRHAGDEHSALLEDVILIKARGKFERTLGNIGAGTALVLVGTVAVLSGDYSAQAIGEMAGVAVGAGAFMYLGGRLVGKLFDPWRKIYKAPIASE